MKKNICLSFEKLTGSARNIMSIYVQQQLFALMYYWDGYGARTLRTPMYTDAAGLLISDLMTPIMQLQYLSESLTDSEYIQTYSPIILDATKGEELDSFFKQAREFLTYRTVIRGIDVVVTPFTESYDPTEILQAVAKEAKQLQENLFGNHEKI